MSQFNLEQFYRLVLRNQELQKQFIATSSYQDIVKLAHSLGYHFTVPQLQLALQQQYFSQALKSYQRQKRLKRWRKRSLRISLWLCGDVIGFALSCLI